MPADRFRQRLVLIGTSAAGLLDLKTTPIDPAMPGVEIHAQVLESILTQLDAVGSRIMRSASSCCAALVLGLAIIWLAPILSPILLLVFGAAIIALLVGAPGTCSPTTSC